MESLELHLIAGVLTILSVFNRDFMVEIPLPSVSPAHAISELVLDMAYKGADIAPQVLLGGYLCIMI